MGDKYIVIAKRVDMDMSDFLIEVNKKMEEGYIPCGGIAINVDAISHREYFYQAMKETRRYGYEKRREGK